MVFSRLDDSPGLDDSGPLVGLSRPEGNEVRLPESAVRRHVVILGGSGVGKSTLLRHVLAHKLDRKARGLDGDTVVVMDPHADLVRDTLGAAPPEIAGRVLLFDFGGAVRVPGINLLDPGLFPDRNQCVDSLLGVFKHTWDCWGSRLEDMLRSGLSVIYEYNRSALTPGAGMLGLLDVAVLLEGGGAGGAGGGSGVMSPFQARVLSRVGDPRLVQWFESYLSWGRGTRADAVGPVRSQFGAYAASARTSVVLGQRGESAVSLSDLLSGGLVLLVSTAQGVVGPAASSVAGAAVLGMLGSSLRAQVHLPPSERGRCLLVSDGFEAHPPVGWGGLLAEARKYGCSLVLASQSIAGLGGPPGRGPGAGILGNVGVTLGCRMSLEDARIISPEMDSGRVPVRDLVDLPPYRCAVTVNSEAGCGPAFLMDVLPPPPGVPGAAESERAVLEASRVYTVDFQETLEKVRSAAW